MFCSNNTRVAISSRGPNGVRLSVWDLKSGLKPELTTSLDLRFASPRNVACAVEGESLAIVESNLQQANLRVIDLAGVNRDGEVLPLASPARIATLIFSPDGNRLAFGMDQAAYLWNFRRLRTPLQILPMPALGVPAALAFSSDGSWFAASSGATVGQAAVWDLRNPGIPQQFPSGLVMAFAHDQARLATSSGNSIRIWDLKNPGAQSVNLIRRAGPIVAIAFAPDNTKVKAGDLDGRVTEWPLWSAAADVLCARIWRNLSMSEWNAHVGDDVAYESTCPNLPAGAGAPGGPQ
jgi:WD40 repeat protein